MHIKQINKNLLNNYNIYILFIIIVKIKFFEIYIYQILKKIAFFFTTL